MWSPVAGITNLWDSKQYVDPNGMLPLSIKQAGRLKHWVRLIDVLPKISKECLVNGVPDVATRITGYELQ